MSKWTIAGVVAGSLTVLTASFFVGRYTGKKSAEKAGNTFVVYEDEAA